MRVVIHGDGTLESVYSDALSATGLFALGQTTVVRASHVEPWPAQPGAWGADMTPVDGPQLGPFATRAAALDAERAWLAVHRGL